MIKRIVLLFAVLSLTMAGFLTAGEMKDYISRAEKLSGEGRITEARELMQQAVDEHPESSDAHAYLGLYTGMSAGGTSDYMEAGRLVTESFRLLDRAVELDENYPRAYLFRGIMGVQVPKFLGYLEQGIADLQLLTGKGTEGGDEMILTAYRNLEEGYRKKGDVAGQMRALQNIAALSGSEEEVERARSKLAEISEQSKKTDALLAPDENDSERIEQLKEQYRNNPDDPAPLLDMGRIYYHDKEYQKAVEVLESYTMKDTTSAEAYKLLSFSVSGMAEHGYDERIAEDTNLRTNQAFKAMNYMDRAVELSPHDIELRLIRGIYGIMFPFFVGKHQQGVEDLRYVMESDAPDSVRAEATFYMGLARKREATEYFLKVTDKYPESEAAGMVYREMRPPVKHFNPEDYEKPLVMIDFVLGFQDQLPPQTAVWVEDQDGNYIATVYVSGFSGYAGDKQVNLPVWSAISEYRGIDAVTGASIDVGHHIYTWDLRDSEGSKVDDGDYMVRVEASFWPSMKYQLAETAVRVGGKEDVSSVEDGDFVPYLKAAYIPE